MAGHEEIDLGFAGTAQVVCCHRVDDVIVDPGPTTCIDALLAALGSERPRAILLTHIHLDHAAATGRLLREWPGTEVWVHERGAPHMADPTRLIDSATRLYGDRMDELWGEFAPVPQEDLVVLEGGERRAGFVVEYTPGHAKHHVAFLHEDSGLAFAGDVAGVRIGEGPVMPPTPPPDIDLEAWAASIRKLRDWRPSALAITHFGTFSDVDDHLDRLDEGLAHWGERARRATAEEFERETLAVVGSGRPYSLAMPTASQYAGLERYWSKREG